MSTKKENRQEHILKILRAKRIDTQEELEKQLKKEGEDVTQATLSRDIRELHLLKVRDKKGLHYEAPQSFMDKMQIKQYQRLVEDALISSVSTESLVILKTRPGMANALCVFLDRHSDPDILGTIAGDDTIFLAAVNKKAAKQFAEKINRMKKKNEN